MSNRGVGMVIVKESCVSEPPVRRAARRFKYALAALAAGSAAVPFGDNGKLFRDLADLRRELNGCNRR
jgi:hypothetical protein